MQHTFYSRRLKRIIDLVGSTALLTVTAPVHAACAIAVITTSGRPIYYKAPRSGLHGKEFMLYKFRTMYTETEERFGAFPPADAVTGVGRVLRRTSLDELPQLVNVLRGDMSLVGPRPVLPDHVLRYTETQRERLSVRPGITGLAQVVYRNNAPWSYRIEKDIQYIRRLSLLGDARIVLKTIPSVILGSGQIVGQTPADVDDLDSATSINGTP